MSIENCNVLKSPIIRELEESGFEVIPDARYPSEQEVILQYVIKNQIVITIKAENSFLVEPLWIDLKTTPRHFSDITVAIRYALSLLF
jgi:hypothetical protein